MIEYDVRPEIEIFDLSHIHQAAKLYNRAKFKHLPYIQFVMGISNAMPADRDTFEFYVKTVERLLPGAQWCGAGIGKFQPIVNEWSIELGGHTRTGMEDNIRITKYRLASSNAELVRRTVNICNKYKRPVASALEARRILGL
jgi:3-keto-5-aminohexanoate cleavage enzyme